jgi:hypothetical protein
MNARGQYGHGHGYERGYYFDRQGQVGADDPSADQPPLPASQRSWFLEHPWMTFFLGYAAINGVVQILSGSKTEPLMRFDFDADPTSRLKRRAER